MKTLQEITSNAILELETIMWKIELSKKRLENVFHELAWKHVPLTYTTILNIALVNLEISIQEPMPSPFDHDTPVGMMRSNIYWHLITQMDEFVNQMHERIQKHKEN